MTNAKGAGRPRLLNDEQMQELAQIVETGPDLEVDGVVRWRRIDLVRVIEERFGVVCSERAITDYLAELGFSTYSKAIRPPPFQLNLGCCEAICSRATVPFFLDGREPL